MKLTRTVTCAGCGKQHQMPHTADRYPKGWHQLNINGPRFVCTLACGLLLEEKHQKGELPAAELHEHVLTATCDTCGKEEDHKAAAAWHMVEIDGQTVVSCTVACAVAYQAKKAAKPADADGAS